MGSIFFVNNTLVDAMKHKLDLSCMILEKPVFRPVPDGLEAQLGLFACTQNIHQHMMHILHAAAAELAGTGGAVGIDIGTVFLLEIFRKGSRYFRLLAGCAAAKTAALNTLDVLPFPGTKGEQGLLQLGGSLHLPFPLAGPT